MSCKAVKNCNPQKSLQSFNYLLLFNSIPFWNLNTSVPLPFTVTVYGCVKAAESTGKRESWIRWAFQGKKERQRRWLCLWRFPIPETAYCSRLSRIMCRIRCVNSEKHKKSTRESFFRCFEAPILPRFRTRRSRELSFWLPWRFMLLFLMISVSLSLQSLSSSLG